MIAIQDLLKNYIASHFFEFIEDFRAFSLLNVSICATDQINTD